ncbi:hypothetical protein ACFL3V_03305 [Nanoarchaeota archaeon]
MGILSLAYHQLKELAYDTIHKMQGTYLGNDCMELRSNMAKVFRSPRRRIAVNTTFGRRVEGNLVNYNSQAFNLEDVVMTNHVPCLDAEADSLLRNDDWNPYRNRYPEFSIESRDVLKSYLIE